MNKKTVIFDMGGVLVDLDIEDCKKVFREELGYEPQYDYISMLTDMKKEMLKLSAK